MMLQRGRASVFNPSPYFCGQDQCIEDSSPPDSSSSSRDPPDPRSCAPRFSVDHGSRRPKASFCCPFPPLSWDQASRIEKEGARKWRNANYFQMTENYDCLASFHSHNSAWNGEQPPILPGAMQRNTSRHLALFFLPGRSSSSRMRWLCAGH